MSARDVRTFLALAAASVAALFVWPTVAAAEDMESDAVYVPAVGSPPLAVRNPLGTVKLQGWDRPQVRIIAHKRANARGLLDRLKVRVDFDAEGVRITTGFYLSDGAFTPLPLQGGAIDLTIDAPRGSALTALTFTGDIDVTGFRAGARLSSQGGQIRASDVQGMVDTRTLNGNQWLEAIRGSLAASGVVGDLELADIDGKRVDATVYKGQIVAREVSGAIVRLHTAVGSVVFVGTLRAGASYDLAAREGDVRLTLRPAPFTLTARAPSVKSGFTLQPLEAQPGIRRAKFRGGGASLSLASATGEVVLRPAAWAAAQ